MNELPIIDISALGGVDEAAKDRTIQALGQAFNQIGFAVISGHGIPKKKIKAIRLATTAYFKLPLEVKLAHQVSQFNYRGYIPLGFFTPNGNNHSSGRQADQYQGFKLHTEIDADDTICADCDLYGPNKWPPQIPEMKKAVLDYWQECDRVCHSLLVALAQYLNLDAKTFTAHFVKPLTNMTLLHYPARDNSSSKGESDHYGIHPHKDTDVLTLLSPDPAGGLFVRKKDSDDWIEALAPEDALIVNVGDMLEIWSGGRFVSTPHKVNNLSAHERISFPYFAVPHFDAVIEPICAPIHPKFDRLMRAGDVSAKIWRSNWPDAEAVEQCYDPYSA